MFKNVASKLIVFAFDAVTGLEKTGDAANLTAYVNKDFAGSNVLADTSATEISSTLAKGYYLFDLAQAETNGDTLLFTAKSTTANVVVVGVPATVFTLPTTGILAPATAGRTLVVDASGLADANAVKVGPTGTGTAQTARDLGLALPAAAPNANGGLPILSVGGTTLGYTITTLTTYTGDTPQTGDVYALANGASGFVATKTAVDTRSSQASVDDLPTNAELATALGTSDDAVLAAVAALNNLSSAQAQAAAAAALAAYDGPTNAEMEARTLIAASYATASNQATLIAGVNIASVNNVPVGGTGATGDEWGPA